MKLCSRWVLFSKEDTPRLYPTYPHSMDPVFEVDLGDPELDKFPLLANTKPMECVLESGEKRCIWTLTLISVILLFS